MSTTTARDPAELLAEHVEHAIAALEAAGGRREDATRIVSDAYVLGGVHPLWFALAAGAPVPGQVSGHTPPPKWLVDLEGEAAETIGGLNRVRESRDLTAAEVGTLRALEHVVFLTKVAARLFAEAFARRAAEQAAAGEPAGA